MASLSGNSIDTTYPALLKTTDNSAIGATEKNITDGAGNASTLALGTVSASFTGTLDLSGATVTGLPGGAPGLVNGTGASSLQSAAALTTTPANASGTGSIALGNGADALQGGGIAIGDNSITTGSTNGIALGKDASTNWGQQIAIGQGATANGVGAGAIMAIGPFANCNANDSLAIGYIASVSSGSSSSVAIGTVAKARATNTTALGRGADATASGAVALGANVTASTANTVTIKRLQMLDYASLNYADDTAAAAGGIPLGGVYHTSGALKVRIV